MSGKRAPWAPDRAEIILVEPGPDASAGKSGSHPFLVCSTPGSIRTTRSH
jgi:hypothetical protein